MKEPAIVGIGHRSPRRQAHRPSARPARVGTSRREEVALALVSVLALLALIVVVASVEATVAALAR